MGWKTKQLAVDRNGNDDGLVEEHNSSLFHDNNRRFGKGAKSSNIVGNSSDDTKWVGRGEDNGYKSDKVDGKLWADNAQFWEAGYWWLFMQIMRWFSLHFWSSILVNNNPNSYNYKCSEQKSVITVIKAGALIVLPSR